MQDDNDPFNVYWTIRNYSMLLCRPNQVLSTPRFKLCKIDGLRFKLLLFLEARSAFWHGIRRFNSYLLCSKSGDPGTLYKLQLSYYVSSVKIASKHYLVSSDISLILPRVLFDDLSLDEHVKVSNDSLSIRLEIACDTLKNGETVEISTRLPGVNVPVRRMKYFSELRMETTVETSTRAVLWSIRNFETLPTHKRITVPVFTALKDEQPSFYVTLNRLACDSVLAIKIRKRQTNQIAHLVRCRLSVFVFVQEEGYSCEVFFWLHTLLDSVYAIPPFLDVEKMTRDRYFARTNGELRIKFEFALSDGSTHSNELYQADELCPPFFALVASPGCRCKEFVVLRTSGRHRDLIVTCKNILGAGSEVFREEISNLDSKEGVGIITVDDVPMDTLKNMLSFLKSGPDYRLLVSQMCSLYMAAVKYRVPSLLAYCSHELESSFNLVDVCSVLELALKYENDRLIEKALDFIDVRRDSVFGSIGWNRFMTENTSMAVSVMHTLLVRRF